MVKLKISRFRHGVLLIRMVIFAFSASKPFEAPMSSDSSLARRGSLEEPTYPIVVALASMLVAPAFSAFTQSNPPIVNPPNVDLPMVAPPIVTGQPLRPQTFGGR